MSLRNSAEIEQMNKNSSEFLGGHADIDILFPFYKEGSAIGNVVVQYQCDLECYDFDSFFTKPCRWHNEKNGCDGVHDELDWIRMRGAWGKPGDDVFMKTDRPDGFYLFVGIQTKLPEMYSAMLVSDPIQCQEGDGVLKFKFWTSPGVKIRVCTRFPSMGKRYNWCSEPVKRNSTKLANVQIPGSLLNMFEIVIEAYSFSLDAFWIPHFEKPINVTEKVCRAMYCDFDIGDCTGKLSKKWEISDEIIGPKSSGISELLEGSFGYVKGPGDATLSLGKLQIPRTYGLQFCYFSASLGTRFKVVEVEESSKERIMYVLV
ncbi:unnamed protein product [Caenorhabditis angaria]|uniref:MAM domain-containing protein n=1 Tax=Caenorhabditis angaria TaxID=860376 RepID=A0A9P1IZK4_9PELO|nr:unnamed protein product [Caenorhabditis angaria]